GLANVVTGFFGGMAGCAMIGQAVINVSSGGRGRLSCLVAGVVLLLLVVYASEWVSMIPMAALVSVMIMVSTATFHWKSFRECRTPPRTANLIMPGTVIVTVATRDLAMGVLAGVLLTAVSFARRVSALLEVRSDDSQPGIRTYRVHGQVFFASAVQFANSFDYLHTPPRVVIDLRDAHLWDTSAVAALDRVVLKLRRHGAEVEVVASTRPADCWWTGSRPTAPVGQERPADTDGPGN